MPPPITATSVEKLSSVGRHSGRMPLFPQRERPLTIWS
jgi:hypothetical protein